MQMGLQYAPGIEPLDFGTAIHAGAEVYYEPTTWDGPGFVKEEGARLGFREAMNDWKKRIVDAGEWDGMKSRYDELMELGIGMLDHYFLWAPNADKQFRPVRTEVEFEVPIPYDSEKMGKLPLTFCEIDGTLWRNYPDEERLPDPVVYQGRIDVIFEDVETGELWIVDHKTAAQFGQTEHLELDQQCGSYYWVCQKILGLDIAGVIYSEWRKKVPKEPELLKNGTLSKNKSQSTTPEMYRKRIEELGQDPGYYADFLQTLNDDGQMYFRRIQIHRRPEELAQLEANIVNESIDMIDNPRIYPNPSRWNCNGCQMRTPCLLVQEGSDVNWYLENTKLYQVRTS